MVLRLAVFVGIKTRTAHHGQDLPGLNPFNDDKGRLRPVPLHGRIHGLLDNVLEILVNRQDHIGAILGGDFLDAAVHHLPAVPIQPALNQTRASLEILLHELLDAARPDAIAVHESKHMAQHAVLGI